MSVFFSLFINDPELEMSRKVTIFADDTKLFAVVKAKED